MLSTLLVAALVATGTAWRMAANANYQHRLALSRQLAVKAQALASTSPVTARRLVAAAWHFAPTAVSTPLTGHTGPVNAVAFSPDGRLLATASVDKTARLWDLSILSDPFASLCDQFGSPTRDEWGRYAPGEPYQSVCPR